MRAAVRLDAVARHVVAGDKAAPATGVVSAQGAAQQSENASTTADLSSPTQLIEKATAMGATDAQIDSCLSGGRQRIVEQLRALLASLAEPPVPLDLANHPSDWPVGGGSGEDDVIVRGIPAHVSLKMLLQGPQQAVARKTKIVCTLGPACWAEEKMAALLDAGCNVARMNFSHGSHQSQQEVLDRFRAVAAAKGSSAATLVDTKGPEIRTAMLKDGQDIFLDAGQEVTVFAAGDSYTSFEGFKDSVTGETVIGCSYAGLASTVSPGDRILFADGMVVLSVVDIVDDKNVRCVCVNSTKLGERKNGNLPGLTVDLPVLMDKDIDDLQNFACKNQVDYVAISFVQSGDDVQHVRRILDEAGGQNIQIISKIENEAGLVHLDEILKYTDGVMVARGDLGMEMSSEKIPLAQKWMITKCNQAGKFVINATQLLESMIGNPLPTRAEMTDVANSVFDGADATMLSGETANGSDPHNACATMAKIAATTELACDFSQVVRGRKQQQVAGSENAQQLVSAISDSGAQLAVCLCDDSELLREIAACKPATPVIAVTTIPEIARSTGCLFGVWPCLIAADDSDAMVPSALDMAAKLGLFADQEGVVVVLLDVDRTVELLRFPQELELK
jgi:pyruvate kinase